MKKLKTIEEALHWGNIVFECVNSNLEAEQWCKENGIDYREYNAYRQSVNRVYVKDIPGYEEYFGISSYSKNTAQYWNNLIQAYRDSGLPRDVWCRSTGINLQVFLQWLQRETNGELDKVLNRDELLIEIIQRDKININHVIWYSWIMKCRNQSELNQPDFCKENSLRYRVFKFYSGALFPSGVKIAHKQIKRTPQQIARLLKECSESGLTVKAWLELNGIAKGTYDYWRKKALQGEYDDYVENREELFTTSNSNDSSEKYLEICKKFCASPLTQAEFAKQYGINYGTLGYWYEYFITNGILERRKRVTAEEAFNNSNLKVICGDTEIRIFDESTRLGLLEFLRERGVIE